MKSPREQAEDMAQDRVDVEKLARVVNEAVAAIAVSTNLPASEVLDILESIHVEMVGELETTLMAMGEKRAGKVDVAKMSRAIEKAIASISHATDLDTDEITTVFSKKPGASVEDVVSRLHEKSRADRGNYA